jgi:mRNA interferase YafQ
MREIEFTSQFKRDYRKLVKSTRNKDLSEKLEKVTDLLCSDSVLPKKYKDHPLKGDYLGSRECHIKPDLLLIYFKTRKDKLVYVRMGSHSELF